MLIVIGWLCIAITGCASSIPKKIQLSTQSKNVIGGKSVTLFDNRPAKQRRYRSPAEMKDTIHGLGDDSFTIPPIDYVSKIVNGNSSSDDNTHNIYINSLEMHIYDPSVSIQLTPGEKSSIQYMGPLSVGMATLFQSMMASSNRKRYMVIELKFAQGERTGIIEKDGYIKQSSINQDIEIILKSVGLELATIIEY
ncbi:MAG: hypothetical protein GY951_00355 [Psychromonas sp.]|nr:hypothetical protein [Psychromonas sp.]